MSNPEQSRQPERTSAGEQLGDYRDSAELPAIPVVPPQVNREIFQSALRATLIMLGALTILGVGIGGLVAGTPGVWGALMGVGVALVFSGTTIVSVLFTASASPTTMMAVVLGAWIAKMALLLGVLAIAGQLSFYHRVIFAIVMIVGAFGSAILDMYVVVKGREPYVRPH